MHGGHNLMKIYNFNSRERELGRVVFALTLNKKRMTERIVIGRTDDARRRLERGEDDNNIYYDETRPLGNLLLNFESNKNGEWNKKGMSIPLMVANALNQIIYFSCKNEVQQVMNNIKFLLSRKEIIC
jgi:hypothetical protein